MIYLLPETIDRVAERTPEQEAIRIGQESLTYAALATRANQLAHLLRELCVQPGDRVGIYMNKCYASAIALYGIMKTGAVYVPLDPAAPTARLKTIIEDCGIRHLVTNKAMQAQVQRLASAGAMVDFVVGIQALADPVAESSPSREAGQAMWRCIPVQTLYEMPQSPISTKKLTEDALAYILYTSGSTGTPKGIMHSHRSGLSFANWAAQTYGLTAADRVSNHAPLHFDLSTFDFFATAVAGATTVIIPEPYKKMPASLSKLIADEKISIWYSVPFALIQLVERGGLESHDLDALRWVLFAGEVFPVPALQALMERLPTARFSNLYGPTETNVCTYYHVPEQLSIQSSDSATTLQMESLPIGRGCENAEALVMDEQDQSVASGEVGELYIGGSLLMQGYWGRDDLNQRAFYRQPITEKRFYRTGDLVQQQADGNFQFLGRKDRQIKIRGYRVELDEIENALMMHPLVEEGAALLLSDKVEHQQISAVVTLKEIKLQERQLQSMPVCQAEKRQNRKRFKALSDILKPDTLIKYISKQLPWYAIPSEITLIEEMPRTSTGKLDRRALHNRISG